MYEAAHFPTSELDQIQNFRLAREKIKALEYQPLPMQKLLYLGLLTLMPTEIEQSGALEKDRMAAVASLVKHQIALNDYLDFTGSGRNDIDQVIAISAQRKDDSWTKMRSSMERVFSPEQISLVLNALEELKFVEEWATAQAKKWTLDQVTTYRNVVNAINNLVVTTTVFGFPDELVAKLQPLEQPLSFESLRKKYAWIIGNHYQSEAQRVIMIMHNLTMAGQIDDDIYGEPIDTKLNIHSYATVARDQNLPFTLLHAMREKHLQLAIDLGLGKVATLGIDNLQRNIVQRPEAWLVRRREGSLFTKFKQRLAQQNKWPFAISTEGSQAGLREHFYVAGVI